MVLARTYLQAEQWRRRHLLKRSDVVYVGGPWKLAGRNLADYDGVLLPGFCTRPDWTKIADELRCMAAVGIDWPLWLEAAHERALL